MNDVRCVDVVHNRIHVDTAFSFGPLDTLSDREKLTNTSSMKQWGSRDAADVAVAPC